MKICRQDGVSKDNIAKCKALLSKRLPVGSERCRGLCGMINEYFDTESKLLTEAHLVHNISSDIIESDFGIFKDSMLANKTNGFTESILYLPLRPKLNSPDHFDIKNIMERRTVKEVKQWKLNTLEPNPMVKRKSILTA